MAPVLTAFARSPDGGRGLARDMRVRWALEEAGRPYEVRLLTFEALKAPDHLARHPFGQIPTYEEDGLVLFESGAIVLHVARSSPALLPAEPAARARAVSWLFAALSTLEPPVLELDHATLQERDRPWAAERLEIVKNRVRQRLAALSRALADARWLDGAFSAGDLMTVSVLLRLRRSGLLDGVPPLAAYVARAEARPAYARAFAAQLAVARAADPAPP